MTTEIKAKKKVPRLPIFFGLLAITGAIIGYRSYNYGLHHQETDDAQIDGNISAVLPRVAGYLDSLYVKDNMPVKKGDILLKIDDREMKLKVDLNQAALDNAIASVEVAKANVNSAQAAVVTAQSNLATINTSIKQAQVNEAKNAKDLARYVQLLKEKSVSQQQFDNVKASSETAELQVSTARNQLTSAEAQVRAAQVQLQAAQKQIAVAQSVAKQKEADLATSKLQLSYAKVLSPSDGVISKRNIQPGQYIQAGQTVINVVGTDSVWATANFKETQLGKMKPGQKTTVLVDAYPGKEFKAQIQSFAGATGSKFALLPPDNSSGNFVKVVQRVPVKILFVEKPAADTPLRAGMNIKVIVDLD